jgi:hypothetical protein
MKRALMIGAAAGLLAIGFACEPLNACDEYVNYLCDCDQDINCDELRGELTDASQDRQDECQAQMACYNDQDAGEDCGTFSDGVDECG